MRSVRFPRSHRPWSLLALLAAALFAPSIASGEDSPDPGRVQLSEEQRRDMEQMLETINSFHADQAFCLGYEAMLNRKWGAALDCFMRARKLDGKSIRIRRHILACLYHLDNRNDFEKEAAELERIKPNCVSARLFRGSFLQRKRETDQALQQYMSVLEVKDADPLEDVIASLRAAVKIHLGKNDGKAALEVCKRIIEMDPSERTVEEQLWLARLYQWTGDDGAAYDSFLKLTRSETLRTMPLVMADALWSLAVLSRKQGKLDKSNQFLTEMLDVGDVQSHERFRDAVALAFEAGKEAYEKGEYATAYELFRRVSPTEKDARVYHAKAAIELGRTEEGAELVDALVLDAPDEIEVLLLAMKVAFLKKDNESIDRYRARAIAALRAKLTDEEDPLHFYFLGTLQLQDKRYEEAVDALKKALAMNPPKKLKQRCLLSMAMATEGLGRTSDAQAHLETILIEDSYAPALYQLARLLCQSAETLNRAGEYARRAIEADPSNPKYITVYLDIYLKRWEVEKDRGKLAGAIDWVAGRVDGRLSSEVCARLGDGYALAGDGAKAALFWRKAIGLAGETSVRDRELIQSLKKKIESNGGR